MDKEWRLIIDGEASAAYNMAIDEAVFLSICRGESPPTLRLYAWSSPAISLGFFQKIESSGIDTEYCRAAGIALVRRVTGGRAVLHGHDLTFSIALQMTRLPDGFGSISASHRWLMSGIVAGLRLLGLDARLGPGDRVGPMRHSGSPDCFAALAQCDVRLGSNKIAGSAQVRKQGSLLEQGSIPHTPPLVDYMKVYSGSGAIQCLPLASIGRGQVESAICEGFAHALGIDLVRSECTASERRLAAVLESERYSNPEWTLKRDMACIDKAIRY